MLYKIASLTTMKLFLSTILLFCLSQSYFGQTLTVTGTVSDFADEKSVIPDVKVFTSSKKGKKVVTEDNGNYSIEVSASKENDTIFFQHVGFENTYKIITPKLMAKLQRKGITNYKYDISLNYYVINDFIYTAKKVDTVFGSEKVSVEDFIILPDDRMLLLVYEKTMKKGAQILLTDANQKEINTVYVPGDAVYLYEDYAGINYVVCQTKVLQINIVKTEIRFLDITQEDFFGFHQRVIDTIGGNYYYSNFNNLYPAVKFIVTERDDSSHVELLEVKDKFMMELYRAQYKYVSGRDKLWAYRKEQETGIDKEIWIGAASFTQDILYKPVYAPLFVKQDTVHIFDQYKSFLYKFDQHHDLIDSVKISYYKKVNKEEWEQPLIKDDKTNQIFALYDKGGYNYLKMIDCQKGTTSEGFKLSNRFVEQIKIINGYAYYIYRPYESPQKKFLYKEKLVFEEL